MIAGWIAIAMRMKAISVMINMMTTMMMTGICGDQDKDADSDAC